VYCDVANGMLSLFNIRCQPSVDTGKRSSFYPWADLEDIVLPEDESCTRRHIIVAGSLLFSKYALAGVVSITQRDEIDSGYPGRGNTHPIPFLSAMLWPVP
jgi:hypothetical protein